MFFAAGKNVSEDELEQMLEQGNSAVFTEGVRHLFRSRRFGCLRFSSSDHHGHAEGQANFGRH